MKIQLAIDRVSIQEAISIIEQVEEYVDIIEIGTSLIKEFGMASVREIRKKYPNIIIFADIKTMDEAKYEFELAYRSGADILSVMGASSLSTIRTCQEVAIKYKKEYAIDLLEVNDEKLHRLEEFDDAIKCIHASVDDNNVNVEALLKNTKKKFRKKQRISLAGGISLGNIPVLLKEKVDIIVVGNFICKSNDCKASSKEFRDALSTK
ncbi:MAG: 3-hexulose-6-phosphate synthase [Breznakia sp.]